MDIAEPELAEEGKDRCQTIAGVFGRRLVSFVSTLYELIAFGLISLTTSLRTFRAPNRAMGPLIRRQIYHAGVRLLPLLSLLALALGFIVIGQMIARFSRIGAHHYAGMIMVIVIVRELGPLVTAMLVLSRVGTATVIELATARALGEIEALEALGIDPIRYLVVPRIFALGLSIFSLTVYFVSFSIAAGYLFAFLQDLPLPPSAFLRQLADALRWDDFLMMTLKSIFFGALIAVVSCYEGLAKPLRLNDISAAATRTVMAGVSVCVLLDAVFIVYLLI